MDIKVIASTKVGNIATKEDFDIFGGKSAGVCYMSSSFDEIENEDINKTMRRINQTKTSGHHSVYDHSNISLYISGMPKIIAMIINNEKQYATSEKSGRYTVLKLSEQEELIYKKWIEIFKDKITSLYKADYPQFFSDSKIEKLAQENARYLTSIFSTSSMVYTTTYRQFNYLISFLDKQIAKSNKTPFEIRLNPYIEELSSKLKALPYYDEVLTHNEKSRSLSLFARETQVEEYFGDVYATTYKASFAELAQAQRHRTISYSMRVLDGEFYVPEIIKDDKDLVELWLKDLNEVKDNYPHAMLLEVNELGTLDNFILKMKERKCTFAQFEINQVTIETLRKYAKELELKSHQRAEELILYTKGSRCTFPDFKCTAPCGFALGINETRKI
ncbi:MAG: FAD-dependent thymidylate synthase [Christensenellales bacterium]